MKNVSLKFKGIVKVHPKHIKSLATNKAAGGQIAAGFETRPDLDMQYLGGRTIPNLSFRSFYLGGAGWSDADIQNIDSALSAAMSDPHLNNVMQQYFPDKDSITTNFLGSA